MTADATPRTSRPVLRRISELLAVLAFICVGSATATASTITVQVSGIVTDVSNAQGLLPFPSIAIGQPYSMTYQFAAGFPDSNPSATVADYFDTIEMMTVVVNGTVFEIPLGTAGRQIDMLHQVNNDRSVGDELWDSLAYMRAGCQTWATTPPPHGEECYEGGLFLLSAGVAAPTVLTSTDAVPVPLDFLQFSTRRFRFLAATESRLLGGSESFLDRFEGSVDEVRLVSAVPEPSTLILVGLGLLAAGWSRRRRRRDA